MTGVQIISAVAFVLLAAIAVVGKPGELKREQKTRREGKDYVSVEFLEDHILSKRGDSSNSFDEVDYKDLKSLIDDIHLKDFSKCLKKTTDKKDLCKCQAREMDGQNAEIWKKCCEKHMKDKCRYQIAQGADGDECIEPVGKMSDCMKEKLESQEDEERSSSKVHCPSLLVQSASILALLYVTRQQRQ